MSSTADLQIWTVKEPYLNIHCQLGEGPYYEKQTNSLRWVDIKQKRLHSVDLAKGPGSVTTLQLDTPLGVTADIEGIDPRDKILLGAKYGMAVLDRRSGQYEYITRFHPGSDKENLRSNDGAVDPHGRFWLGTMTDFGHGPFQPDGSLHLFVGRNPAQVKRHPVTVPNGISWSPDHATMYFSETASAIVHAHDYAAVGDGDVPLTAEDGGAGAAGRHFYRQADAGGRPGAPDGHRVDVEGNVWHALWGGSAVVKISPSTGRVVGEVRLPTPNVTCVQFVGTELFVTTAAPEEGQEVTPEEAELGGALFRVDVGVRGVEPNAFKMDG